MVSPTNSFIFCPPLLGKPDPAESKPKGIDTRRRILQKGAGEGECFFGLYNLLRERYKAPNTQKWEERNFEQLISRFRRELYTCDEHLADAIRDISVPRIHEILSQITKENLNNRATMGTLQWLDSQAKIPIDSYLQPFIDQKKYQNLAEYFEYLHNQATLKVLLKFLPQLNPDLQNLSNDEKTSAPILYGLARRSIEKKFHLKVSSWLPTQPLTSLIEELKLKGPLGIIGNFGSAYFNADPHPIGRKINGREIYGWNKNDPIFSRSISAHTYLIVGAEIIHEKGFVYFINPSDPSDPQNPESQKIYVMSYDRLTSIGNLNDLNGCRYFHSHEGTEYAIYRSYS